uniref:Uncharacterized protein n=1 Tax=Siphoviridae sp. ctXbO14 TaxID=2827579 RepID=A0A8S5LK45_9CAUD|nr:MAG TPA: hypothetical protein [Siphoviridae sp. ctXbO14]DAO28283.1 MAG TPA: hypothetical protein [Caudoviricetes sp.]
MKDNENIGLFVNIYYYRLLPDWVCNLINKLYGK